MESITAIQYSTYTCPETNEVSYWGNIVIDDSFMIQFHGDSEECTYSVPSGDVAAWNGGDAQDEAREKYSKTELVDFVESQGFENNLYYVMENGERI
jgi:hypothetical protein